MRKIDASEQKKYLVEMLSFFDDFCRKNNIKYSLIGGSLIGAIRHNGFIPWDDDIDVILTHENYIKLINCFEKRNNRRYQLFDYKNNQEYYYPYSKLIDTKTVVNEKEYKIIKDYGLFIDIFEYNSVPDNDILYSIHYNRIQIYKKIIGGLAYTKNVSKKRFLNYLRYVVANIIGKNTLINRYLKILRKYNGKRKCNSFVSNWPIYGKQKERQKSSNFTNYIDATFENIKVMITEDYDFILKTTYGDYMKLPPESERIFKHELEVFEKEEQ